MKYFRLLPALLLAAALAATGGCKNDDVLVDERPPDFTLEDLDGEDWTLSDTQGDVVLLNFYSPTCGACRAETPDLVQLYRTYSDSGLVVVGVTVQANSIEEIEQYRDEFEVPYPLLIDNQGIGQGYGVRATPTTYVIDRDVTLYGPFVGAMSEEQLKDLVVPLL